ncbi:MAG: hypothetical protein GXO01_01130 [Epsilonproteobacteria bacterium]|nr:hypothetical protein [Campylobacterota bacterium]
MKKLYLLFSHKLTPEQIEDAKKNLGVEDIVYMPSNLQEKWSNVPAEMEELGEYSKDFMKFLDTAKAGDYVLIQGDFGLTYKLVNFTKSKNLIPIYATTKRVSKEVNSGNKVLKVSEFDHVRFRKY